MFHPHVATRTSSVLIAMVAALAAACSVEVAPRSPDPQTMAPGDAAETDGGERSSEDAGDGPEADRESPDGSSFVARPGKNRPGPPAVEVLAGDASVMPPPEPFYAPPVPAHEQ